MRECVDKQYICIWKSGFWGMLRWDNPKNAKMDRCMILSMPENINQYSWFSAWQEHICKLPNKWAILF